MAQKPKSSPSRSYREQAWLLQHANLTYEQLGKLAKVSPGTLVEWLIKNEVILDLPDEMSETITARQRDAAFLHAFYLYGNPVIKKNSNPTRNGMRLPNKRYVPYENYNIFFLQHNRKLTLPQVPINQPVTIKFIFYKDSRRRTDISNLYEAPQDVMVKAGIIQDDNCNIVVSHHSDSRVYYDSVHPRTEIYIYKANRSIIA